MNRQLKILYAIFALTVIVALPYGALETSWDSPTYFAAWETLKSGKVDMLRTPLYPAIIGTISDIAGHKYCTWLIAALQYLIFGVSIKYFYLTALSLTRPGRIPFYTTLLYILSPSTSLWAGSVMTESLSISLIVMWVYTMVRLWQGGYSIRLGVASAALLTFLLMLRPAFVYLAPACLCFIILYFSVRARRNAARALRMSLVFVIPFALLAAYCMLFKATYGILSPSCVSTYNDLEMMRTGGGQDFSLVQDQGLRAGLQKYIDYSGEETLEGFYALQSQYGLPTIRDAINLEARKDPMHYVKILFGHLYRMTYLPVLNPYSASTPLSYILIYLSLSGRSVLLLTSLFVFYLVLTFRRGERPWFKCILAVMVISNIFTSIIAAQSDWIRLCVASAPLLFLAIGIMASRFTICRTPIQYSHEAN